MSAHRKSLILAILAFCMVIPGTVSAATISFAPSSAAVDAGNTANITLVIDSLPEGLAGYDAVVAISDPAVAEISSVSFPAWASLSDVTGAPSSSVTLNAVDLNRNVESGATGIELATITIRGKGPGSATISVGQAAADADGGDAIETTSNPGSITVKNAGGGSQLPVPLPGLIAIVAVLGAASVVLHRTVSGKK